jgi:hypothetical protein
MQIDLNIADFVLRIVAVLVIPAVAWLVRCILALRRDLEALHRDLEKLRGDHCGLEDRVALTPSESALHKMALAVEHQAGEIKSMREVLSRVESVVTRHENYLLEHK